MTKITKKAVNESKQRIHKKLQSFGLENVKPNELKIENYKKLIKNE